MWEANQSILYFFKQYNILLFIRILFYAVQITPKCVFIYRAVSYMHTAGTHSVGVTIYSTKRQPSAIKTPLDFTTAGAQLCVVILCMKLSYSHSAVSPMDIGGRCLLSPYCNQQILSKFSWKRKELPF